MRLTNSLKDYQLNPVQEILFDSYPRFYGDWVNLSSFIQDYNKFREVKKLLAKQDINILKVINHIISLHNVFGKKLFEVLPMEFKGINMIKINTFLHCMNLSAEKVVIDHQLERKINIELGKWRV